MDIKAYFSIIIHRIPIMLVITVSVTIVAACISFFVLKPVYTSSITLFVNNTRQTGDNRVQLEYGDIMAGQYLVKDYREIIKSGLVTDTVIERLRLKSYTTESLARNIGITLKNETRVLTITVSDPDPMLACDIVNTVGDIFITKITAIMQIENVQIIEKGKPARVPSRPRPLLYIGVSLAASAVGSFIFIFFLEFIDDRVKTLEALVRYDPKAQVLGVIPDFNLKE